MSEYAHKILSEFDQLLGIPKTRGKLVAKPPRKRPMTEKAPRKRPMTEKAREQLRARQAKKTERTKLLRAVIKELNRRDRPTSVRPTPRRPMRQKRQIRSIAKWINENLPELYASCMPWRISTDRKPAGLRYITHVGKGYRGYKISIYKKDGSGRPIFDYDNCGPFGSNQVVEDWLDNYIRETRMAKPKKRKKR